jgi:hypothetical protein
MTSTRLGFDFCVELLGLAEARLGAQKMSRGDGIFTLASDRSVRAGVGFRR